MHHLRYLTSKIQLNNSYNVAIIVSEIQLLECSQRRILNKFFHEGVQGSRFKKTNGNKKNIVTLIQKVQKNRRNILLLKTSTKSTQAFNKDDIILKTFCR